MDDSPIEARTWEGLGPDPDLPSPTCRKINVLLSASHAIRQDMERMAGALKAMETGLEVIRSENSQLRHGIWYWQARAEQAERLLATHEDAGRAGAAEDAVPEPTPGRGIRVPAPRVDGDPR